MNKYNKKKDSSTAWVRHLFQKPGVTFRAVSGKQYFATQYLDSRRSLQDRLTSQFFSSHVDEQGCYEVSSQEWPTAFEKSTVHPVVNQKQSLQCTVLNCIEETHDTKTFRLGIQHPQHFKYLPGQYLTLAVTIAGRLHKRSYSLASSSTRLGAIEITVKRAPNGGLVSNWLNDHLKVGDSLAIKGPYGNFGLASPVSQKLLFLAAGSGIVPIMSMLRWLVDTEAQVDVVVILSFKTYYDIIYREELKLMTARHRNIKLHVTLTHEPPVGSRWQGLSGRLNTSMLANSTPDLISRTVYLCGPESFMAESKRCLLVLGALAENIFCESFFVSSPNDVPANKVSPLPAREKSSILAVNKPANTESFEVHFAKSDKKIATDGSLNLLQVAERTGIAINHECRAGSCGECMVKCLNGRVEMNAQAEIDDIDKSKGWVYSCCAYPTSDLVLDI